MSIGMLSRAELHSFFPLRIQLAPVVAMTQDQFFDFCRLNPDKRFERSAEGELMIMLPSGGGSGVRDASVVGQLYAWWLPHRQGKVLAPSGGFILPNGANRAPDGSWVSPNQLATNTPGEREKFWPVCPFFLVEIMSPSDSLNKLQEKMEEYLANGCQLGWLIDPERMQVHIYRAGEPEQILDQPQALAGDPELPGFVLDLEPVWRS
jgi:Uma2 family endonuclease